METFALCFKESVWSTGLIGFLLLSGPIPCHLLFSLFRYFSRLGKFKHLEYIGLLQALFWSNKITA